MFEFLLYKRRNNTDFRHPVQLLLTKSVEECIICEFCRCSHPTHWHE